jgi:hypothetical protein
MLNIERDQFHAFEDEQGRIAAKECASKTSPAFSVNNTWRQRSDLITVLGSMQVVHPMMLTPRTVRDFEIDLKVYALVLSWSNWPGPLATQTNTETSTGR